MPSFLWHGQLMRRTIQSGTVYAEKYLLDNDRPLTSVAMSKQLVPQSVEVLVNGCRIPPKMFVYDRDAQKVMVTNLLFSGDTVEIRGTPI